MTERMYRVDVSAFEAVKVCEANARRIALFIQPPAGVNPWTPNLPVYAGSKSDADSVIGMETIIFPSPGYIEFSPKGEMWFKPPFALPGAHLNVFERYEE